jgi:hypothetical protein
MTLATYRITQDGVVGDWGVARKDLQVTLPITLSGQYAATNYLWEIISEPIGCTSVLTNATTQTATLTLDTTGGYLVRYTVDEGLATKDIQVLYLGIPLANSNLSIPAFNETYFDNSEPGQDPGYWYKVDAMLRWVDTWPARLLGVYDFTCRIAVDDWTSIPAGTLVGDVFTATADGSLNDEALDGITDLVEDQNILIIGASGDHAGIWQIGDLGSATTPFVLNRVLVLAGAQLGATTYVMNGNVYGGTFWRTSTVNPLTIDAVEWVPAVGLRTYGNNLSNLVSISTHPFYYNSLDYYSNNTIVAGGKNVIGAVDHTAVFGYNTTLGTGASFTLVAGEGHTVEAITTHNLISGQGNTIGAGTLFSVIGGQSNTVKGSEFSVVLGSDNAMGTSAGRCNHTVLMGSSHEVGDDCRANLVAGSGNTLAAYSNYNAILGQSNAAGWGTGNLIAGYSHTVVASGGPSVGNFIAGQGHTAASGISYASITGLSHVIGAGCNFSSISGVVHTLGVSCSFNVLGGQEHKLGPNSPYNALFGSSHDFSAQQSLNNLIVGHQHTGASVSGGMTHNLVSGASHVFNVGGVTHNGVIGEAHSVTGASDSFTHNLLAGKSHSITAGGAAYSFLTGEGHTISAGGCTHNSLLGRNCALSGTAVYNLISGRDNSIVGGGSSYNVLLGYALSLNASITYTLLQGQTHTFTVNAGGSSHNVLLGARHTIGFQSQYCLVSGSDHQLLGSHPHSYITVFGKSHTFTTGQSDYTLVFGESNTLPQGNSYCLIGGKSNTLASGATYNVILGSTNTNTAATYATTKSLIVGDNNVTSGNWHVVLGDGNVVTHTGVGVAGLNAYNTLRGASNSSTGNSTYCTAFGFTNQMLLASSDTFIAGRYNTANATAGSTILGSKNLITSGTKGIFMTGVLGYAKGRGYMHINSGGHPTRASAAMVGSDAWLYSGGGQNLGMIPHSGATPTTASYQKILYMDGADNSIELTLQTYHAYVLRTLVIATNPDGARAKSWEVTTTVTNGAIVGTPKYEILDSTSSGTEADWDIVVSMVGSLFRITATGSSAEIVTWQCYTYGPEITSNGHEVAPT